MALLTFQICLWCQDSGLIVTSPDFEHEGELPERFTCDGLDVNPTLYIDNIPDGAKSLVVMLEDPDVASTAFNHWIVWNIPPDEVLDEGSVKGIAGINSLGKMHYRGPCPVAGSHRYFFRVYALDTMLDLDKGASKHSVAEAMASHILATGEIMGRYQRK